MDCESGNRRDSWTKGWEVILADRRPWYLPQVDVPLMVTTPLLGYYIAKTLIASSDVASKQESIVSETVRMAHYHSHLARIGVLMLARNYDLSHNEWKALTSFDRLTEMLDYTRVISGTLNASAHVWEPFLVETVVGTEALFQAN